MGLIDSDDRREMSHKLVKELLENSSSPELSLALEADWQLWQNIDTQINYLSQLTTYSRSSLLRATMYFFAGIVQFLRGAIFLPKLSLNLKLTLY